MIAKPIQNVTYRDNSFSEHAGSTDGAHQAPVAIQAAQAYSYQRCLVTARACMAGESILAVPWLHALTAEGSMQQLRFYEAHGKGTRLSAVPSTALQTIRCLYRTRQRLPSHNGILLLLSHTTNTA